MRVGTVTEIKPLERRVGLTPAVVATLVAHGHEVFVQSGAGAGVGLTDTDYANAGGQIVADAPAVFAAADLIVKVKEPQSSEIALLTPRHTLFTYLHLAPDPEQTKGLMASGCTAIAYETILDERGGLPLLTPMSQVAGRMAAQVGAAYLLAPAGGRGLLMGGVPGVAPAKVIILGGGVSGFNAAEIAVGMRADVTIMDISPARLAMLDAHFEGRARTVLSSRGALLELLPTADLVIGCVLVAGASAPKLVKREDLKLMRKGAVLVDVAIDQGGCFETSHATTHVDPTYVVDGVVHYCVANMPGAAPLTSTYALGAATTPYVLALADMGVERALAETPGFAPGLNIQAGRVVHPAVAASQGLPHP
ncbi:alanine dehydrogenase [Phenylobacterium aquaticum]|uniref:alanine dehydrogenase n=1 Tax=Phenylobacterium aquaticum TaxID=1763816 RepID=UPI0026EED9D0|nr:alanine dehydrogenase [Phenylobacterium aquaticum]